MMNRRHLQSIFQLALLTALAVCSAGLAHAAQTLKICDDESGWPPYTFADPKNPKAVTGAAVELVVEILKRADYQPQITLLPWNRCLLEIEEGSMAMTLSATHTQERAQKFLLSKPYYRMNSALYYLTSKYPTPPKVGSGAEMKKYKYCGLLGYNYAMYDIPESNLDAGARSEATRFEKLRLGRCDFVLGDVEILNNFAAMGQIDLTGIGQIPIPGAKPKEFHMLITRMPVGGDRLLRVINDGIAATIVDKTYAKIFKKYGL